MTTGPQATKPTADDRAHRLDVAIANLSVAIVQLRMLVDQVTRTLETAGLSSIQTQALGSHTCSCEIALLDVSSLAKSLTETKDREALAALQMTVGLLH